MKFIHYFSFVVSLILISPAAYGKDSEGKYEYELLCVMSEQACASKSYLETKALVEKELDIIDSWFKKMGYPNTNIVKKNSVRPSSSEKYIKNPKEVQMYSAKDVDSKWFACHDLEENPRSILGCYYPSDRGLQLNGTSFNPDNEGNSLEEKVAILAHELFHSTQSYTNPSWLGESTAEAVAILYVSNIHGKNYWGGYKEDWDFPFTKEDANHEYGKSLFFTWLANTKSGDASYLKSFTSLSGSGLSTLQKGLKEHFNKGFEKLYPEFIAKDRNKLKSYSKYPTTEYEFDINSKNIKYFEGKVNKLAADPSLFISTYKGKIKKTEDIDRLRLITVSIDTAEQENDLRIIHEDKNYKKKEKAYFLVAANLEGKTPLGFVRISNVAKTLKKTEKQKYKLKIEDENTQIEFPSCVKLGTTTEISFDHEYFDKIDDRSYELIPSSGKMLRGLEWKAPSSTQRVSFDIKVKDVRKHIKKKDRQDVVLKDIWKIDVSKKCGIRMTLKTTGETITYDPETQASKIVADDTMYMQDPYIYMKDEGAWGKLNMQTVAKMMLGFSGMMGRVGRDGSLEQALELTYNKGERIPSFFDFFRLPLTLTEKFSYKKMLEKYNSRKDFNKKITGNISDIPDIPDMLLDKAQCINEKGKCKTIMLKGQGASIELLYSKNKRLKRVKSEGEVMTFKYGVYNVNPPANAPTFSFMKN